MQARTTCDVLCPRRVYSKGMADAGQWFFDDLDSLTEASRFLVALTQRLKNAA
jgi:hypothetical protein